MEFGFTKAQEMLRQAAVEVLKRHCPIGVVRELTTSEHGHSQELWAQMAELGWVGLVFPEEYGGDGAEFTDLVVLLEEMGRALVPGAFFSSILLGGSALLEAANEEQKERWLAPLAAGQLKATLALTEMGEESGPEGVALKAEQSAAGFLLDGTKLFVPDAQVADLIICAARTSRSSNPADGITLLAVDRASEGIKITPLKTMDATRRLYEVSFSRVCVPADRVLGTVGEAWPVIQKVINRAAIGLSAEMVGGAQRVLDLCVEYAKTRVQFGRPIGSFQAIQHRCAEMLLLTESARSAVYAAACAVSENSQELPLLASIAKAYTSDAYSWAAGEGIQLHGGMGYTWECDLHLYFKRAKADEVTFGDATYHRARIADLIGLSSSDGVTS
jgi:alkylation response protein AidB-like acyl-CoA dehydrogenase